MHLSQEIVALPPGPLERLPLNVWETTWETLSPSPQCATGGSLEPSSSFSLVTFLTIIHVYHQPTHHTSHYWCREEGRQLPHVGEIRFKGAERRNR